MPPQCIRKLYKKPVPKGTGLSFSLLENVGLDCLVCKLGVAGGADYEFDVFLYGISVEPLDEIAEAVGSLVVNELVEIVDIEMGDVVVACANAADKAFNESIAGRAILANVDKTSLIRNIVGELVFVFNNDNVACAVIQRFANHVNELSGFAGSVQTHDYLNQDDTHSFNVMVMMEGGAPL